MLWKGTKVTISNYSEVFKDYPVDIREVIRGAILDSTPIEPYIRWGINPYFLWQIKLCLDEGIDNIWFTKIFNSGELLYEIRGMNREGINLKPLEDILLDNHLSEDYCKYVIKWYKRGVVLDKYNIGIIPKPLLEIFDFGISSGYPMYLFNTGILYGRNYIIFCLRILSNGKDITKFLGGEWDEANLSLLAKYSAGKYYDKMIDYITPNILPSVLEGIYDCLKVGMPIEDITALDEEGLYVYSKAHLALIREAYVNKYDYTELLNIGVSEASDRLNEMKLKASKRLSGVLRKN